MKKSRQDGLFWCAEQKDEDNISAWKSRRIQVSPIRWRRPSLQECKLPLKRGFHAVMAFEAPGRETYCPISSSDEDCVLNSIEGPFIWALGCSSGHYSDGVCCCMSGLSKQQRLRGLCVKKVAEGPSARSKRLPWVVSCCMIVKSSSSRYTLLGNVYKQDRNERPSSAL